VADGSGGRNRLLASMRVMRRRWKQDIRNHGVEKDGCRQAWA
jgi:hypothetical protein